MTRVSAVGSVGTVRERLAATQAETDADELMLTAHIYDHAARLRSFELAALAMCEAGAAETREPIPVRGER
jgi:alkanesulfonate monooxygenase SsuD/methylene tetrahydromethanopterin reductase-like flavin-dependent oxidoreductase (luciferase family)